MLHLVSDVRRSKPGLRDSLHVRLVDVAAALERLEWHAHSVALMSAPRAVLDAGAPPPNPANRFESCVRRGGGSGAEPAQLLQPLDAADDRVHRAHGQQGTHLVQGRLAFHHRLGHLVVLADLRRAVGGGVAMTTTIFSAWAVLRHLVRQYQTIMGFENVELRFTDDALEAIAEEALKRNVGARGLKIIIEELMLDIMYTIPSQDAISECVVTREVVENRSQPITLYRKAG